MADVDYNDLSDLLRKEIVDTIKQSLEDNEEYQKTQELDKKYENLGKE